jgi:hypothetical protein
MGSWSSLRESSGNQITGDENGRRVFGSYPLGSNMFLFGTKTQCCARFRCYLPWTSRVRVRIWVWHTCFLLVLLFYYHIITLRRGRSA